MFSVWWTIEKHPRIHISRKSQIRINTQQVVAISLDKATYVMAKF